MLPDRMMYKGKAGLFSAIESQANLRNAWALAVLSALLLAAAVLLHFTVPEIRDTPLFMAFSGGMLAASAVLLAVVKQRHGAGGRLKWILGGGFILAAVMTTSTLGAVGSILFVFPMLLSIQYCSFLFSVFISCLTVMGTFVPMLLNSFLGNYDLNVVRLAPDAVIRVAGTLEASLGSGVINGAGTKINELLSVFLPMLLFVNLIAVVAVSITAAVRKILLEQYRRFQTTRE